MAGNLVQKMMRGAGPAAEPAAAAAEAMPMPEEGMGGEGLMGDMGDVMGADLPAAQLLDQAIQSVQGLADKLPQAAILVQRLEALRPAADEADGGGVEEEEPLEAEEGAEAVA